MAFVNDNVTRDDFTEIENLVKENYKLESSASSNAKFDQQLANVPRKFYKILPAVHLMGSSK